MPTDVSRHHTACGQNDHVKAVLAYFTRPTGLIKQVIPSQRHLALVCLALELESLEPLDELDDLEEPDPPSAFELDSELVFELDSEPLDDSLAPFESLDPLEPEPEPFAEDLAAFRLSVR
jgi:hypothetical protein